jgi:hypothetical protein
VYPVFQAQSRKTWTQLYAPNYYANVPGHKGFMKIIIITSNPLGEEIKEM